MAKKIDPQALLFYNDYSNTAVNAKSTAALNMMLRIKALGAPVDGIGKIWGKLCFFLDILLSGRHVFL